MGSTTSADVAVVGAGVPGLTTAWRLAQRGLRVVVAERAHPGAGASSVAAGMLAPVTEADFGEEELLKLNLESAAAWPAYAAELEESTGLPTGYVRCGALAVAVDRDDAEEYRRVHDLQRALGLQAEWLAPSAARRAEPALAPRIAGAIDAPDEAQADPVALIAALERACEDAGVRILCGVDAAICVEGDRATGIAVGPPTARSADAGERISVDAGERISADAVVLAAGAWSGAVAGLPPDALPRVRPVKGQLLHLRARPGAAPLAERIIRTPRCYVVPRPDGRVVVGATSDERGFDTTVDGGAVHRLLEAAWEVLPDIHELEFEGALAGLRPGTPDNRPLIGAGPLDGLYLATGHYRNGILQAPVTAERVVRELTAAQVAA